MEFDLLKSIDALLNAKGNQSYKATNEAVYDPFRTQSRFEFLIMSVASVGQIHLVEKGISSWFGVMKIYLS